jgi:polyisoprenoid-binding protein YceI
MVLLTGAVRRLRLPLLAAAVSLGGALFAPAQAPQPQPGMVNLTHSKVYVFVGKKGAGHEHGVEGRLSTGELHLDPARPGGKLTFDMRSFAADTDAARKFFNLPGQTDADTQAQVTDNMLGAAVLDVAKFPSAEFEIRAVRVLPQQPGAAGPTYQLDGEFTLHGVKKPLSVAAVGETVNGWTRLRGRFAMKQTDFDIKPFSKFLGAVGVTDELHVYADLYVLP